MQTLYGFSVLNAESEEHALALVSQYNGRARVLAGGTDLLVAMKHGKFPPPQVLINIKTIDSWNSIRQGYGGLSIGTLTRVAELETSALIQRHYPALAQAASQLGSVQVRNIATVGGNLCNASPSAELAPPFLVYGAKAVLSGGKWERVVPLEEFFKGPGKTVLGPGELLTNIVLPPPDRLRSVYLKFAPRRAMDIAVVGVAAALERKNGTGACVNVRIALGAVAPTPVRVCEAEQVLEGQEPETGLFAEAAAIAAARCEPITDVRATADYRRHIVGVFTQRALFHLTQGEYS